MSECKPSPVIEIDAGRYVEAVAYAMGGDYLVGAGHGIRMWRVKDGKEIETMEAGIGSVLCLAVSNDGKWVAGGTSLGSLFVWDAETCKRVFADKQESIHGLDFSPDATRLVTASGVGGTAIVVDIALGKQQHTLDHPGWVRAAKYAPQGDRIATATRTSVRIWNSSDASVLADIPVRAIVYHSPGLVWCDNLFVTAENTVKQLEPTTASLLSEWLASDTDSSCIAVPQHGQFIAYSSKSTITFWDTSTHAQLDLMQHPHDIRSITFSPDDNFLAISGLNGKITIASLSHITDLIPLSRLHPTFREPELQVDVTTLDLWKQGQLENVETSLTKTLSESRIPSNHVLACRALIHSRLQHWDTTFTDAEKVIKIQPSILAYIAKSRAHVARGERDEGYRACDIAFELFRSSHASFLLLVKAIIVFIAGEHLNAISRVDDLITTVHHNAICYVVQAYMYLLLGNSRLEKYDYAGAIRSFEHARSQMRNHKSSTLSTISLIFGWKFDDLAIVIQQRLGEALNEVDRTVDALECLHHIVNETDKGIDLDGERRGAILDLTQRVCKKLVHLGDVAMKAQRRDEAISQYTAALYLNLPSPQDILFKRGSAFLANKLWDQALDDANQLIALDPASPRGLKMKHAALDKKGDYASAVDALEMVSKTETPSVQKPGEEYINPETTRAEIRKIVQRTVRHLPHVLINTTTGRLHNRTQLAFSFESQPVFIELVSSTTTRIDYARIKREVRQYFRYAMLSHRWQDNEPLYDQVINVAVYDLSRSQTHDKLQTFCKFARDAGINWAWSDTCCINKDDRSVLDESLVAMFKWYEDSALTIVFLLGVRSSAKYGTLAKSIWNKRGWTLQEYIASRVVRFYTEDWTPYLGLRLSNHKESQEIISEMQQVTGVSVQQLLALRPGLSNIREKLRLASDRETTRVEDAAYSLLGIFSVTGVPIIYGDEQGPLFRLLSHILSGSGDVSVLAWTGEPCKFNSCLPARITVFSEPPTYLPLPIPNPEMERFIAKSRTPSFELSTAIKLYDRLTGLAPPWFTANRLKLPCIAIRLPSFPSPRFPVRLKQRYTFRVNTWAFGAVEIKTRHDLSRFKELYLIHPWLDTLLERDRSGTTAEEHRGVLSPITGDEDIADDESDASYATADPRSPLPATTTRADKETRARRLAAYIQQPFGALLVMQMSGRAEFVRIATESMISVQFLDDILLNDIFNNVATFDIL